MKKIIQLLVLVVVLISCSEQINTNFDKNNIDMNKRKGKLILLGTIGGNFIIAYDISDDASIIAGSSANASGTMKPFLWKNTDGMKDIIPSINNSTNALGVSGDGKVVILDITISTPTISKIWKAYHWTEDRTEDKGLQDLGTLRGNDATPRAISKNGNIIVGHSYTKGKVEV